MSTLFRFIQRWIADFANLLFPNLCLGCSQALNTNEQVLCALCRINVPETNHHREPYAVAILNKFAGKVPIRYLASYMYFRKGGIAQKLIHQIKYKGQKDAARQLAEWYGYQLKQESRQLEDADLLISVPLHKRRFQQRGYNQSDWIAMGFAETLGIPSRTDILVRTKFTTSQTHKNRLERWENVETVFAVVDPDVIKDKHIVLVDDVLTTGATVEACAIELLKAGCSSVSILTLAVAGR